MRDKKLTSWLEGIALAAGWLILLVVLLMDAARRRRLSASRRWQGYGTVLAVSGVLASAFSEASGWPVAQLPVTHHVIDAAILSGVGLLAIGLAIQYRAGLQRER